MQFPISCLNVFHLLVAGGLFGSEREDRVIENAFRFAVNRINRDRNLLKGTRLKYDIQRLRNTDSYQASKRGSYPGYKIMAIAFAFGYGHIECLAYANSQCDSDVRCRV
jgi:hypothetical protein